MAEAVRGPPGPGGSGLTLPRLVRSVWAGCLVLAGLNHALILARNGLFWDYHGVGVVSATYWTSLTILDLLMAALLLIRPCIGVPAAAALILGNVAHNLFVTHRLLPDGAFLPFVSASAPLLAQIAFLLFVGATFRTARRDLAR